MDTHQIEYLGQTIALAIENGIKAGLAREPAPASDRAQRIEAAAHTFADIMYNSVVNCDFNDAERDALTALREALESK